MSAQRPIHGVRLALGLALVLGFLHPGRASADRFHTVRSGDSLARIARRYHVTPQDLAAANRMRTNARIRPGQQLRVPDRGVVYVRSGQTLSHIAAAHHCSVSALAHANHLRTRSTLQVGQRLHLPGYVRSVDRDWGEPDEPGVVSVRRRDVLVRFRLLDDHGRVSRGGLLQLGQLMVRHVEDPQEAEEGQGDEELEEGDDAADIEAAAELLSEQQREENVVVARRRPSGPDPRLGALLAKISDHFGGRRITIVSGFREARGFTRETSQHVVGHATDIRVDGVPNRAVWDYCRSLSKTGCGYYPNSTFVHVDVRARHAQWVDWSRPGKRPRYGSLSGPGRRRMLRDPVRRRITRPGEVPLEVEVVDLEAEVEDEATHAEEPPPAEAGSDEAEDVASGDRADTSADG